MGKVKYYDYEIEDRLRQVDINRNDIGMTQINVLPIPNGVLEGSGSPPRPIEFTAIGDKLSGKVSVEINGESNMREFPSFTLGQLTFLGRGEDDTGTIKPGKYAVSFTCSMTASQLAERLHNRNDDGYGSGWIDVIVHVPDTFTDTVVFLGETETITIPENFTKVRILYNAFVNDDSTSAETFDDDVTFDIYPFLRLEAFEDEPFEPYKPDLQTQITSNNARTADVLGIDGSINLFPIDKGVVGDPVIYDAGEGEFAVMQADVTRDISSVVGFSGTSDDTTETTAEYRTFFNWGYRWDDNPFLFGDLVPGDYVLSFDVLDESGFSDVADFYFEIYEKDSTDIGYGDKIATCTGSNTEFTVTAAKPMITVFAVAKRHAGHSWNGAGIYVVPFLRRKIFATAARDEYRQSIEKQLAELRYQIANMGGYNETQTDSITDSITEVTQ